MKKNRKHINQTVDQYIAKTPIAVQQKLKQIQKAIKSAAPKATERMDYFDMPGYSYDDKLYDYNGMFVWFSYKKPFLRLHIRPPVLKNFKTSARYSIAKYKTTASIISFPDHQPIPLTLIKALVKASLKVMKEKI